MTLARRQQLLNLARARAVKQSRQQAKQIRNRKQITPPKIINRDFLPMADTGFEREVMIDRIKFSQGYDTSAQGETLFAGIDDLMPRVIQRRRQ